MKICDKSLWNEAKQKMLAKLATFFVDCLVQTEVQNR